MALPCSGTISMSQVNTELKKTSTQSLTLNDTDVRSLATKPSGTISMSDLYCKSAKKRLKWRFWAYIVNLRGNFEIGYINLYTGNGTLISSLLNNTYDSFRGNIYYEGYFDTEFYDDIRKITINWKAEAGNRGKDQAIAKFWITGSDNIEKVILDATSSYNNGPDDERDWAFGARYRITYYAHSSINNDSKNNPRRWKFYDYSF